MAEPAKSFEPESVRKLQSKAKLRLVESRPTMETENTIDPSPARAKLFLVKSAPSSEPENIEGTAQEEKTTKLKLVKPSDSEEVYESSGTEASDIKGNPQDIKKSPEAKTASTEDLSNAEKSTSTQTDSSSAKTELEKLGGAGTADSLYKKKTDDSKVSGRPKSLKGWAFKHQKKLFGGGIIGTIVGLFMMFTFASGPLQFLHFSQLLQQFHLGNLQSAQDHRFLKQVRFWRYASNGEIEKTRLGLVGRKVAPKFEAKLNATGFKSTYTTAFGNFNGYEIDRTNEKFKGKSYQEIKKLVKDQYGLDVVQGSELGNAPKEVKSGGLFIDARGLGFLDSYRLNFALLQEAGYSKLSSAIGARTLCNLAGCTLHPLKKLSTSLSRTAEEKYYAKQRANEITKARELAQTKASGATDAKDPNGTQTAQTNAADVQAAADTANNAGKSLLEGDATALESQKASISSTLKLGGKAFAVGGFVCMLNGVNQQVDKLKKSQVEKPAVNLALNNVLGEAAQITSGQDMNTSQLKYDAGFLNGKDSTGKQSSWLDAETFQTQLGNPGKGVPASDTLKTIGSNAKPFPEVDNGFVSNFCSVGVQLLVTSITIFTAGALDIANGVIQGLLQGQFIDKAAHWLSSVPIDPFSVGADLGNVANYGMHLFASWQFAGMGGVTLSKAAMETQAADQKLAINDTLSRKGLIYKLFNTQDANSTIAKLIDEQNPDPVKNVARIGSGLFNVKGIFGSIGNIFNSKAKATGSTVYDYGLPSYGFSDAELYGPIGNESPYDNAGKVAALLEDPTYGQQYIDKAQKCFGVTLEKIPTTAEDGSLQEVWGVNSRKNTLVNVDSRESGCESFINTDNWLRIRLFILDSVTMDNMACYQGDGESCNNVGIASDSPDSSTGDSTTVAAPAVTTPSSPTVQDYTCTATADKNQPDWAKSCSKNLPIAATDYYCNPSVGRLATANFKCPDDYALDYQTSGQHKGAMLFNYLANGNNTRQAMLYIPTKAVDAHLASLNTKSDSLPLVIYLHGRGTDTVGSPGWYSTYGYWPVNTANGLKDSAGLYANGSPANIDKAFAAVNQYGAIMVDPQGQGRVLGDPSYAWSGQLSDISKLPDLIQEMLPWLNIDPNRVYVMGSSMGGQESLAELSKYPNLITAAYVNDPVTDLAKQYTSLLGSNSATENNVATKAMAPEVGGAPSDKPADYEARSPISMLTTAVYTKPIRLDIDQHDTTVNISQKMDYYNAIKTAKADAPIFKYSCDQITSSSGSQNAEHAYILAVTKNGFNNAFGFFYNSGNWLTLNSNQTIAAGSIDCSK